MGVIKAVENDIAAVKATYEGLGVVASFFSFMQGRSTTFAIVFTICGIVLAFQGKLTGEYVGLVGAIQTLIVAHSVKEDLRDMRSARKDKDL